MPALCIQPSTRSPAAASAGVAKRRVRRPGCSVQAARRSARSRTSVAGEVSSAGMSSALRNRRSETGGGHGSAPDGRRSTPVTELRRDRGGMAADELAELGRADPVQPGGGGGDAQRALDLAGVVEDRRADASDALLVLLVVDGVAARAHALEVG